MQREHYEIEIKRHVFIRAIQREIRPDMIEATILGGEIYEFGRNLVKFVKQYRHFKVICVGEIKEMRIIIRTVEVSK